MMVATGLNHVIAWLFGVARLAEIAYFGKK